MALEPYQRKIGIAADPGRVNYAAPEVESAGPQLRGMGRSLLDAAEPVLRDKAQRQGEEDAGKAPLVRDEKGNLKRAEPLPGGGLYYRDSFRRAANHLYSARILSDAEVQFEQIRGRLSEQPQEALNEMRAHVEAVLETVPGDVRTEVETGLLREMTQRFNGLTVAKVERDRRRMTDELELERESLVAGVLTDMGALIDAGDWEGAGAQWTIFQDRYQKNQDARKGIGALSDIGDAAEDEIMRTKMVPMSIEIKSIQAMREIIAQGPELIKDPLQLNLLVEWTKGDQSGGTAKVAGKTFDEYWKFVPDPRVREALGAWANKQLADLDRAAADARAAEKEDKDREKDEDILNGVTVLGDAAAASNPEARKAVDAAVNRFVLSKAPNITQFMLHGFDGNPTAGRQFVIDQIARHGYMPEAVEHFIVQNAGGGNADVVVDFTSNMLSNSIGLLGQRQGWAVWRQLPDRTRAIIERNRNMIDQGLDPKLRASILATIDSGKTPQKGAILEAFKDADGKPSSKLYLERRNAWVKKVFWREEKDLPGDIRFQIDKAMPAYASVHGNDGEAALQAAVRGIAAMWTPSPLGVKGYVPTELAGLNISLNNLDRLFGNYMDGSGWKQPGGFSRPDRNGRPTARLELIDDSQLPSGVGNYRILYYDKEGNLIPGATRHEVNIDNDLARYLGGVQKMEERMKTARVEAARRNRDSRTGVVKAIEQTPLRGVGR